MKKLLFTTILLCFCVAAAYAANERTGTASFSFLKLQSSVRAAALGNTFVAIADDPSAAILNPAGLTQIESRSLQIAYNSWLIGSGYSNGIYALPLGKYGAVGGSITYLNFGDIAETSRLLPGGTGRNFGSSGTMYVLSYGYELNPSLSLGMAIKSIQQNIDQSTETAMAYDAGFIWDSPANIKFGGAVQNIGNALPTKTALGLSSKFLDNRLLLAGEASIPSDNSTVYHFGVEYQIVPFLTFRGGFKTRSEEKAGGNLSLGLGFDWNGFKVDYAYIPYEALGDTHKVGLRFRF